jgi:GNAT superfamily N-acetyltransferase
MITLTPAPALSSIDQAVEISTVPIDAMSALRHLHASSARRLAAGMLSDAEINAFVQHVYSSGYSTRLADVVVADRMVAARMNDELVGSAGWLPANDSGSTARLIGVFVSPLYARLGIGRRVVQTAEGHARRAGFSTFTIRAPLGSSDFFEHIGYHAASHGVWPLTRDVALPVAFLRKVDPPPSGVVVQLRGAN